jgi:uncharacterized protein YjiS (DUF1127 family)
MATTCDSIPLDALKKTARPEPGSSFNPAKMLVSVITHGFDKLLDWQERYTERRRLAQTDDYMLKDMGLTRGDIAREIAKPFWQS